MAEPVDLLLLRTRHLMDELRARCAAESLGDAPEELLVDGYAAAHALEGARRRMRALVPQLSQREVTLAARERDLRGLLTLLRERIAQEARAQQGPLGRRRSGDEAAPQRLH